MDPLERKAALDGLALAPFKEDERWWPPEMESPAPLERWLEQGPWNVHSTPAIL